MGCGDYFWRSYRDYYRDPSSRGLTRGSIGMFFLTW